MNQPRPSASNARRVNRLILRGQTIGDADKPVADALLARFDGLRGRYWVGLLVIALGVGNAVVRSLTTHATVWLQVVTGIFLTASGAWWIYTIHRVRRFQDANR